MFSFLIKKYRYGVKVLFILAVLFVIINNSSYASVRDSGGVIIFPVFTGNTQHDEIMKGCEYMAGEAFSASGRFVPAEYGRREQALKKSDGKNRYDLYRNSAALAGADIFCVLELSADNGEFSLHIRIAPVNEIFSGVQYEKNVTAKIYTDLSLKCAREISLFLEHQKLKSRVVESSNGLIRIDSGQWHGLSGGAYNTSAGRVNIREVSRYTSLVEAENVKQGEVIEFNLYPDMKRFIAELEQQIAENSANFYGTDAALNKRRGSIRESIIGTCLINQGASFCLPGYGSFLSVEYMGIEKGEADAAGIAAGGVLTAVHLVLPSAMNGFDINFFPWVMDSDKNRETQRLQYFLWGTLPLTFSTLFYNQLAYQYHKKDRLPPLFADHDTAAAAASVFVPGGGMFYKGYQLPGWGFYLSEMSLAGYAVYDWDNAGGKYAAGAAAVLKIAEIILSYNITPSYKTYRKEIGSAGRCPSFSIGMNNGLNGPDGIAASVSISF